MMINSPIPRIDGKRLLRNKICDIVSKWSDQFNRYIEVFGGGGWVLFSKEKQADLEIYNDADGELVNLMRCIKYHCSELQREIDGFYNSREIFQDVSQQLSCRGFTDIQRAARYFIKMRLSFGADGKSFGCSKKPLYRSKDYLSVISDRLKNVLIEKEGFRGFDYRSMIDRNSFFYLDPPYHTTEKYYDIEFTENDHKRLALQLSQIQGKFLLSYNDDMFIRDLYRDYDIVSVSRNNNLSSGSFKELLIRNY
ncbi:MAG: DNA adenine methylase [[Eubacterium] siraeum]